jgi:hypothetical protein
MTIDATTADEAELAIPSDANTVFLDGLLSLAVLAGCYVAAEIVLAFVLSLVLQPGMRQLNRLYLPLRIAGTRSLASGLLQTVLVLFFLLVSGDTFLRASSKSFRGSKTSARLSKFPSKSSATCRSICLPLPS